MWSKFGISGKFHAPKHKVEHPLEPNQDLYLLCDVPHVIKCIRNHLLRHKYGMLFSQSTAVGLKAYQRLQKPGFEDCNGTVQFTRLVNDHFDALNVKLPRFGIKSTSKEIEVIQEFLDIVDDTERNHMSRGTAMFALQITIESLRVTLASVRDVITDLLSKGAEFVLTGKLNQDLFEISSRIFLNRFFGMTRSFGGDEDHPTIVSFSHIYRLLTEPTLVLATVQETMKLGKKDKLASHERLQETLRVKGCTRSRLHPAISKRLLYYLTIDISGLFCLLFLSDLLY
ncbi:hypothetical protein HPB47_015049 [Ixodes persulcatus]|uniref:Uncharacterized protein n=1 Tax=Ixodes persulcatus TaxID=34615 RepID=A0AC60QUH2_IXOPE|nr:hypothetical protein HPB47_015049 [Ixodes persulcatus]